MYRDDFGDWKDIQREYQTDYKRPDKVFLATYNIDGYDGFSHVLFRNGDKYYFNEGSHCSCYGLENQFDPEEYENKELFIKFLFQKGRPYYLPQEVWDKVLYSINRSK